MSEVDKSGSEQASSESVGGLEARQDERFEVEGYAEVTFQSSSIGLSLLRGRILNISKSGCFVQTLARVPVSPDTKVHIDFAVYGFVFRIDAASRFARTKVGIGFRFVDMDATTERRLNLVLEDVRARLLEEPGDYSSTALKANNKEWSTEAP